MHILSWLERISLQFESKKILLTLGSIVHSILGPYQTASFAEELKSEDAKIFFSTTIC